MDDYLIQSYVDLVLLDVKDGGRSRDEPCSSNTDQEELRMKAFADNVTHIVNLEMNLENFQSAIDKLQNTFDDGSTDNDTHCNICLCSRCVRLLNEACTLSLEKVETDIAIFEDILTEQELRECRKHGSNYSHIENLSEITRNSCDEAILKLKGACSLLCEEIAYLDELLNQQTIDLEKALKREEELFAELNYLDYDQTIFNNGLCSYTWKLSDALLQEESLVKLSTSLYSNLFQVIIEDIGKSKSYLPVSINGFRLGHRPKGNLKWKELNTAWSEACLLLLICGGKTTCKVYPKTNIDGSKFIFFFVTGANDFVTSDFRIVPLVDCSKIILKSDTNIIYNLGYTSHESKWGKRLSSEVLEGIKVFIKLLGQLCYHVERVSSDAEAITPIPFHHSNQSLGTINIALLDENDDKSWLALIYMAAYNLRWLVNNSQLRCQARV